MENDSILLENQSFNISNYATLSHSDNQYYGLESHSFTEPNASAIQPEELLYIDSAVEDYQVLIDSLTKPTEVVLLDSQQDGLIQITELLQQYQRVEFEAIHIVSHGDVGQLFLGNISLNQDNLDNYQDILSSWSDSITEDGDILLYGCNVGKDLAGAEFLSTISQYTQADILASTDLTGSEDLGGDWDLEFAIGEVETETVLSSENAVSYNQTLNSVFGDRLDIIFTLDGSGNVRIIDPNADASLTNFISFPRIDYEPIDLTPVNITNAFGTDAFGNFVDVTDVNNFDTILPPVGSNVPFSFNFGQGNFGIIRNNPNYNYDNSELNSWIFNFDASSINFNANNFDFSSAVRDGNSITFRFISGAFNFESVTSRDKLKFTFKNYFDRSNWNNKVKLSSGLEFDATSVEFGSDSIKFKYKPESFRFDKSLFVENANLFAHKSINPENYSVSQFNASDYRALEYAFEGDKLFDSEYYLENNNLIPGMNSFTHYNENGNLLGSNPNPAFDNSYYNSNNPSAATSRKTALEHYLGNWRAGLPGDPAYDPEQNTNFNPFFRTEDYFTVHDDVRVESYDPKAKSPLEDLIAFGLTEGRITNGIFQADNVLKVSTTITPDSNPSLISQTQADFESFGLALEVNGEGNFQVTGDRKILTAGTSIFGSDDDLSDDPVTIILGLLTVLGVAGYNFLDEKGVIEGFKAIGRAYSEGVTEAGGAGIAGVDTAGITFGGYQLFGTNTQSSVNPGSSNNIVSIDYGNASLADILGKTPPFPGQTESQRRVEIFRPEAVDGVQDYQILPPSTGVIIPRTTEFPQNDPLLEDILNGGVFLGAKGDELEGEYVLYTEASGSFRGLKQFGSLTDKSLTPYERTIGESLVAEGNQLIGVDDDNVRKTLGIPLNTKGVNVADYLSITPSGRFNLTEVKGASPDSTTGAKIGDAIEQLNTTYERLIELVPNAKLGKVEVAIPEGATIPPPYEVKGNQILRVTLEGTEVIRIGGKVLTIRR